MAGICEEAEECVDNLGLCQSLLAQTMNIDFGPMSTIESLASSAVLTAAKVRCTCMQGKRPYPTQGAGILLPNGGERC